MDGRDGGAVKLHKPRLGRCRRMIRRGDMLDFTAAMISVIPCGTLRGVRFHFVTTYWRTQVIWREPHRASKRIVVEPTLGSEPAAALQR